MNKCSDECTSPCNWDYVQLDFIVKNINPNDYFLDIGSYQGLFIEVLLRYLNPNNITGVEMDINTFDHLKQRFQSYGVNLMNLAISDKKETIDYFRGCDGGCPNIFGTHENNSFVGPKIGTIESDTLDNLFLDKSFDFVKIDIEGAEVKALSSGINFLKKPKVILIECHTENEFPEILDLLINHIQKDVYCLKNLHKKTIDSPFSYQIVAIDREYIIENGLIKKNESR